MIVPALIVLGKSSLRPHPSSLFTTTPNTLIQPLASDFHLAFSPYAPAGPSVLNTAAYHQSAILYHPSSPTQPLDYQLAEQGLLQAEGNPGGHNTALPIPLPPGFTLPTRATWIAPTAMYANRRLGWSEEIGLRAIRQIFYTAQQHGFKQVKLKYAGGEATLHFRLVKRLHEEAIRLAQESGLALREVVLNAFICGRKMLIGWLLWHQINDFSGRIRCNS